MTENNEKNNCYEKRWKLVNFCEFDKYATKSYCAIHNVDESLNLGDITKVDETKLEPFNMICGGSPCFVAGTKVITKDGYKNIEDIKVGDMVLTHKNRYMPVMRTGGEQNKEIYSLRTQGFLNTECTDYHPFYCKRQKTSEPEKIKLKDLRVGYYLGSHINQNENNKFNLSDEDCWILGRYVADGHIRKDKRKERKNSFQYQCILSIRDNKVDELKGIVKTRHYNCYPHTKSTHRVVFSSMELVNFIIEQGFGMGAENKVIPSFILDLPTSKLECFLNGYMAGDGCEIGNAYQATTVSKELAMSLCLAIQKVYRVGCCVYYTERPDTCVIENRVVNQKDTYMIRFRKNSQKHLWFIEDGIMWYPIREITKTDKVENVFNIEVEEDHTYTANNIITYNCQDFSVAGKQKGSVWTCKDCGHEYNPLTVHWSERDKCPCCESSNIEKTRSSLLVEYLRVIRTNKPNFGMYENVKNIVGKQFKDTFKMFTDELDEYGYNVYWKVLNAKDYGIPQNRERVYLIFIKKELDNGKFTYPEPFDNGIRLKDILEDEVDEKFYISEDKVQKFIQTLHIDKSDEGANTPKFVGNVNRPDFGTGYAGGVWDANNISPTLTTMQDGGRQPHIITSLVSNKGEKFERETDVANTLLARDYKGFGNQSMNAVIECPNNKVAIRQATKKGYIECELGGVADLSYPESKTRRGRVQADGQICLTITATETGVYRIELKRASIQDYILTIFECLDRMQIIEKEKGKNEERYKKYREILYVLWEEIRKETLQWAARGFWSISEKKVLQSGMHGKVQIDTTESRRSLENRTSNCTKDKRENIEKDTMRDLWSSWKVRCSSYKLELERQFIGELASFMSKMSHQNSQNQKHMFDMWKTDERTRLLQQALYKIQEIWLSNDEKEYGEVSNLSNDNRNTNEMCRIRIRKLTPKECFRLQGFSDENFEAAEKMVSNSQLYKQAGNSIVVDVLYYILIELYKAMPYLFDDLRLSSFFSGIGAFEIALNRLYEGINSGNFTKTQAD